jgi:hypothetical protein
MPQQANSEKQVSAFAGSRWKAHAPWELPTGYTLYVLCAYRAFREDLNVTS